MIGRTGGGQDTKNEAKKKYVASYLGLLLLNLTSLVMMCARAALLGRDSAELSAAAEALSVFMVEIE